MYNVYLWIKVNVFFNISILFCPVLIVNTNFIFIMEV